jgi:F-type H+-transporting ATPase subunit epsilon
MDDTKLKLEIVTPEGFAFKGYADMVVIPGSEGEFAVLAGHIPLIASIRSGFIQIIQDGVIIDKLFVIDGFVEVTFSDAVILVDRSFSALNIKAVDILAKINSLNSMKSEHKKDFDEYSLSKDIDFYQALHNSLVGY